MRATFLMLTVAAAACGGDEENLFDEPTPVPPGPHHTYVVRDVTTAASSTEAYQLGLDVDHRRDDGADNQLGTVLASVTTLFPTVDPRLMLDRGIATGDPILLLSLRGPTLISGPLELHTLAGAAPTPSPCRDDLDETCGRHLDGTASFAVAEPRATVPITGLRDDGVYEGGAGDAVLPFAMGGRTVWLPLSRARAELTEVSETRLFGRLGGAVHLDDIDRLLIPAYGDSFRAVVAAECTVGGTPPACGCPVNGPGETMVDLFDKTPSDCRITDEEVANMAAGLLTPDIDLDGDGVADAMSWGIGIEAVAGQFTP